MALELQPKPTLHRRKSSVEEQDIATNGPAQVAQQPVPPRIRVHSSPSQPQRGIQVHPGPPPSAGPMRTSFNINPSRSPNGNGAPPPSPYRSSFAGSGHSYSHSRTRSISAGAFAPVSPSPLSASFAQQSFTPSPTSPSFPSSYTAPELSAAPPSPRHGRLHSRNLSTFFPKPNATIAEDAESTEINYEDAAPVHSSPPPVPGEMSSSFKFGEKPPTSRHARLHSRNLSVFFPRPGSLPPTTIAEDGSQEIAYKDAAAAAANGNRRGNGSPAPVSNVPSAKLGAGFKFGGAPAMEREPSSGSGSGSATRRGHHHKHSMSHNFFSFLEPGGQPEEDMHSIPTPVPVSPWNPISPFPQSAGPNTGTFAAAGQALANPASVSPDDEDAAIVGTVAFIFQFVLGAWMWVAGQQAGSLASTGLGYWVVFDAFGVALTRVVPTYLKGDKSKRRMYGNARVETVLMFAQSVYLMFSSVYVCKETVEHLLLSSGDAQGHHHHRGDEEPGFAGIEFPVYLMTFTFLSLIASALLFENHEKMVNITGNRIPSPSAVIAPYMRSSGYPPVEGTSSNIGRVLRNPFSAAPLAFCFTLLVVGIIVPISQHRACDLVLACVIAVVTFHVAYRASSVLGAVLLQTSPERGLSGGRMEAFLRAMREVERHPQVLHLPPPHIWQLTPTYAASSSETISSSSSSSSSALKPKDPSQSLVVTLELHVRPDLADDDVLELTKWAWERCVGALHFGNGSGGEGAEAEVTVGIVRG